MKKIFIASDHAGFRLKKNVISRLSKTKKIIDLGPESDDSVDYPDFARNLSKKVASNKGSFGILICGSGMGMSIAANKTKNIRAALWYNTKSTKLSRQHNNANVMTIGSRFTKKKIALKCVNTFLKTNFDGGRHLRRVKKI